jgi:hypothetical protein
VTVIVRGEAPGALALWQRGLAPTLVLATSPAGRAWQARATRTQRAYDRLRTDPRSPLSDRVEAIQRLQTLAADSERLAADLERLRASLIARLAAGAAFAIGFGGGVAGTQRLAAIPPATWAAGAALDWVTATLCTATGAVWRDVRILPPAADVRAIEDWPAARIDARG